MIRTSARKSFSRRLSLNIMLGVSLLFIVVIGIVAVSSHYLIAEEASKSAENMLHATIAEIEKSLQPVEISIETAAGFMAANLDKPGYIDEVLDALVQNDTNIVGSSIAFRPDYRDGRHYYAPFVGRDKEGRITRKNLGSKDYDYFHMDWYQIPSLLGKPVWSEPFYDSNGSETIVSAYSYPVTDPEDGSLIAVLMAEIPTETITAKTAEIHPYEHSNVIMVSRCGMFVSHMDAEMLQGETLMSMASASTDSNVIKFTREMMDGESGLVRYGKGSEISFAVFGPVSNGWSAAILCQYRDVLEQASKMHLILILVGLFGLMIIAIICYYTIRKLTSPLSKFSESALSIAKGDFNTELPEIKSEDEIRQLHDSFVYMEESLTKYIENLKTSTATNERFESELSIARKIQMNMVPRAFPEKEKVDLHAFIEPAKEVGGDLYDFYIKDNILYFAIGDVSGKGVPAALVMAITRAAFRFISGLGMTLDKIVERINNAVADGNAAAMFVTLFAGRIDLSTGDFQFCNAGHNPIIVDGEYLKVIPNIAVGLMEGFQYQMQQMTLKKGSRIILYTDGVTEAETRTKEQFGNGRLQSLVKSLPDGMDSKSVTEKILEQVRQFTDGNEPNDDITIMTIKL